MVEMEQTSKKRLVTSLILCISLGYLGVHKFYQKKYGLGVLYLCTLGLFYVGWIVDCVKLASALRAVNKAASAPALQSASNAEVEHADRADNENEKTYRVAGARHYATAIESLAQSNPRYSMSKKELLSAGLAEKEIYKYLFTPKQVEVVPEPDNTYDPNAIKVMIDGAHVGYIKAGSCAHLLKVIKGNRIEQIRCKIGGGPYKCYTDTSDIDEKPCYELDEGSSPYWVTLYITERKEVSP